MEIIKKINSKQAWVRISDTEAILMTFNKELTNAEMVAEGKNINKKRKRLKFVQEEIKRLKNGTPN